MAAIAALGLFAVSCGNGSNSRVSREWEEDTVSRRFVGTLPCADCPGIDYDLTLKGINDEFDGIYTMSMTYQEAHDGLDMTYFLHGEWNTVNGKDPIDVGTVYRLMSNEMWSDTVFLVYTGDGLEFLDRDRRPIESQLNYKLKEVDED